MNQVIQIIKGYYTNERLRQVITLYSVNILAIPLSVIQSIILTRYLGPSAYGDYKFIINLFNLAVIIFSLGFFQAGNRALVMNHNSERAKEIYGAELIILLFLFFLLSTCLVGYSLYDTNVGEKGLTNIILLIIPFSWTFILTNYIEVLFQADNKIHFLAQSRLLPQLLFLVLSLIIYFGFPDLVGKRLFDVFIIYLFSQVLILIFIISKIKPSFRNLRYNLSELWTLNKNFGFNLYLGSVLAVGFSQLSGVLISYFGDNNSGVGFYSLAITITLPLSFIPNVIATTHYKEFSTMKRIPSQLFKLTTGLSLIALFLTWLLIGPFIKIFYGKNFATVVPLTFIISSGVILHGLADFFNRFLGSNGYGKEIRNSAFIVGFFLFIFNIILIPNFGERGAALTKASSGLVYLICMIWYYKRLIKSCEKVN